MAVSAAANIRGITIKLGGDSSELVKSFKEVNQASKQTANALKDVDKLLKLDPGNVTLLKQKQDLLNRSYHETASKLTEVKKIRDQLLQNNENGKNQQRIEALNREIVQLEHNLDDVKNKANSFSVLGAKLEATGNKIKDFANKLGNVGRTLTTYVSVPLAGIGTAAFKAASDFTENVNKTEVAFGKFATNVTEWADTATDSFGLSRNAALSAASGYGAMAKSMGLSEKQAAEMSITLAGLSGDLSSYYNYSQDISQHSLESVFTGETEALKKFGIVMTQTNLEQFAASQGKVYKELSESEKVMLRYEFVLAKTKDAQGDFARTSDSASNSVRKMEAEFENLCIELGKNLIPILTPIIQKLSEMAKAFSRLDPEVQKAIANAGVFLFTVGPIISTVAGIANAIGTLVGLSGKVATFFGGAKIAAGGAAVAVNSAGAAMQTAAATTTASASAMSAAGTVASGGLLATAAAITGVGGAAVLAAGAVGAAAYQIATHWDLPSQAVKTMADLHQAKMNQMEAETRLSAVKQKIALEQFVETSTASFSSGFTKIKESVSGNLSATKNSINNFGSNARNTFNTTFSNMQSRAQGAVVNIHNNVRNGLNQINSSISSSMQTNEKTVNTAVWNISNGITTGLSSANSSVNSQMGSMNDTVVRSMSSISKSISSGFENGASNLASKLSTMQSTNNSTWDTIEKKTKKSTEDIARQVANTTLKFSKVEVPTFKWVGTNDPANNKTAKLQVGSETISFAKAMFGGAILKGATIFGAMGDKLLQAGEVGSEVVVGTNSLMNMIARTSRANANNPALVAGVGAIYNLLAQYLPESATDKAVVLDNGKLVGALVPAINRQLGLMMG